MKSEFRIKWKYVLYCLMLKNLLIVNLKFKFNCVCLYFIWPLYLQDKGEKQGEVRIGALSQGVCGPGALTVWSAEVALTWWVWFTQRGRDFSGVTGPVVVALCLSSNL